MTNRLKEIKKDNPKIAKEIEHLINKIASEPKINSDDEIKICYDIIILREKFNW